MLADTEKMYIAILEKRIYCNLTENKYLLSQCVAKKMQGLLFNLKCHDNLSWTNKQKTLQVIITIFALLIRKIVI